MESLVSPVTLIVKSCNQQFEDQEIRCELNWTIRKLKQELAEVYPTKPRTEEQKLIYSGQLLHDTVVLKDVLRKYEGQDTHTVHLVFTPKYNGTIMKESDKKTNNNKSVTSNRGNATTQQSSPVTSTTTTASNTSDGLRQRTNVQNTANQVPGQTVNQQVNPFLNANMLYAMQNPVNTTQNPNSPDYLAAQQAAMQAWMQQAYAQYFNQYMNMLQFGAQATPLYASATTSLPANFPNLYTQSSPTTSVPNQLSGTQTQDNAAAQVANNNNNNNNIANPENGPAQRRFPNLVVEEPQENRDWLDISYTMFRLTVILTLIYFYSSPLRCLAVLSIGIAFYFYRIGVFRNQIERNFNLNNVNNRQQQNQQQREGAQNNAENNGDENAAAAGQGTNGEIDTVDSAAPDQNRTSMLVMIRTFIFSFIFSLIPETPAL
uniref:CSON002681 protein n=1 Tax=Culicoides sonorensis TaxID=179676 RepID=A0A336K6F1_CULSO